MQLHAGLALIAPGEDVAYVLVQLLNPETTFQIIKGMGQVSWLRLLAAVPDKVFECDTDLRSGASQPRPGWA